MCRFVIHFFSISNCTFGPDPRYCLTFCIIHNNRLTIYPLSQNGSTCSRQLVSKAIQQGHGLNLLLQEKIPFIQGFSLADSLLFEKKYSILQNNIRHVMFSQSDCFYPPTCVLIHICLKECEQVVARGLSRTTVNSRDFSPDNITLGNVCLCCTAVGGSQHFKGYSGRFSIPSGICLLR